MRYQITQLRDTNFGRTQDAWPVLYGTDAEAVAEWTHRGGPATMFENTDEEDNPTYFVMELSDDYISTGREIAL